MAEIGKMNSLRVVKMLDFGLYLDGGEHGEILLPRRYIVPGWEIDKPVDVFVYLDSDDRIIATTEQPLAEVGECAYLEVVETGDFGCFMHWGLMKDLLVPFKEMRVPMQVGRSYVVYLYLDVTGRIAASSRLNRHLLLENKGRYARGQEVKLLIAGRSELGYQAVIDGTHLGMIHNIDVIRTLRAGDSLTGYIKDIRPDGRINLLMRSSSESARADLGQRILADLKAKGGRTDLTDRSPPEALAAAFDGVSKSTYKKALGHLLRDKKVVLEDGWLRLL